MKIKVLIMVHSRFEQEGLKRQCANVDKENMEVLVVPYQNAKESFEVQVESLDAVLAQNQAHPTEIQLIIVESNYGLIEKNDTHQNLFSHLLKTFKQSDIIAYSSTGFSLQKAQEDKRICIMHKGSEIPVGLSAQTMADIKAQNRYYTLDTLRKRLKSFKPVTVSIASEDIMTLNPSMTYQYDLERECQNLPLIEMPDLESQYSNIRPQ